MGRLLLRQTLVGIPTPLKEFSRDVIECLAPSGVLDGSEDHLAVTQRDIRDIPNTQPDRFQDLSGEDDSGGIAK